MLTSFILSGLLNFSHSKMKVSSKVSIIALLIIFNAILPTDGFFTYILDIFNSFLLDKIFVAWDPIGDLLPKKTNNVGAQLDTILHKIDDLSVDVRKFNEDIKHHLTLELKSNKIQDIKDKIEIKFNTTMQLIKNIDKLENDTIEELIQKLSVGKESIDNLMRSYHFNVFGPDRLYLDSAIQIIRQKRLDYVTKFGEPEQVVLFKYFLSLLSVEYKAMILQESNYILKIKMRQGRFIKEIELVRENFVKHVEESVERMRHAFLSSSRYLFKLDPQQHKQGKTYAEITRFNQIYFTSEANFGSCNSYCKDYSAPRHNFTEGYKYDQRRCTGTIHGCKSEDSSYLKVYQSRAEDDKRYKLIMLWSIYTSEYRSDITYGPKSEMNRKNKKVTFSGWPRGFVYCDICQCLCDDKNDKKSIRKFSLKQVKSDTEKNMVVTGVQIAMDDKIFYLKIRQSPLLPLGRVNDSLSDWKTDDQKGKFFTLRYNHNSIYIATAKVDVKTESNYVVTGVGFTEKDGNLALEVCFTKFDLSTGQLDEGKNFICKSNALSSNRINHGKYGDRPIKYNDNVLSEETKQGMIQFGPSSLQDDVGQSTVPFIDLQPVESTYSALSGVGLQLRSRENSGGFVTPNLVISPVFIESKVVEGGYAKILNKISVKIK